MLIMFRTLLCEQICKFAGASVWRGFDSLFYTASTMQLCGEAETSDNNGDVGTAAGVTRLVGAEVTIRSNQPGQTEAGVLNCRCRYFIFAQGTSPHAHAHT
jgi:hypothetical protein